ncbi:hypothetical protein DL96DRAFT_1711529 [Flagelloscypha sp. PMI_526]|nr:hypothetical protein DL96DRAFT_1711529 [Flagelloscypha sp. PMI_526]
MHKFESYTLWSAFERLYDLETTRLEVALSVKAIANRSNVVVTCTGILCGMIYQENQTHGRLNSTCKVLATMNLLIVTCNRLQFEGHCITELRTRVQKTGPLLPTLHYIVSDVILGVLLILEGFKAGGVGGGTMVLLLLSALLGLGSLCSLKNAVQKAQEPGVLANGEINV